MRLMSRDHQFLCLRSISCAFVGHQLCSRVSTGTSSRVTNYIQRDKTAHFRAKVSRQVQPVPENPPNHDTNYTRCDKTTRFRAKVSRQVQPVPENPPNHDTNYTPRDKTTRFKPKPSHQAQSESLQSGSLREGQSSPIRVRTTWPTPSSLLDGAMYRASATTSA